MRYKITKQHASGMEVLFAECNDMDNVKLFMDKILSMDESHSLKSVYRIYDNNQLSLNFNYDNTLITKIRSQYADQDCKLPSMIEEPFNVIANENSGVETTLARFSHLNDAKTFVEAKLLAEEGQNINITYFIFDGDKFVEKYNRDSINAIKKDAKDSKHIHPSPLVYRLRAPGTAYGIYNTDEDIDNDK